MGGGGGADLAPQVYAMRKTEDGCHRWERRKENKIEDKMKKERKEVLKWEILRRRRRRVS